MSRMIRSASLCWLLFALTLPAIDATSTNSASRESDDAFDLVPMTSNLRPQRTGAVDSVDRFPTSASFQMYEPPMIYGNSHTVDINWLKTILLNGRVRPSTTSVVRRPDDAIAKRSAAVQRSFAHGRLNDGIHRIVMKFPGYLPRPSVSGRGTVQEQPTTTVGQLVERLRRGGRNRKSLVDDDDDDELLSVDTRSESGERFAVHTAVGAAWDVAVGAAWDAYERILSKKYDELDGSMVSYDADGPHHSVRSKNPVRFIG